MKRVAAAVLATTFAAVSLSACSSSDPDDTDDAAQPSGPVDYETAEQIVIDRLEPDWELGTFCLDDRKITENDEYFAFDVGAKEYIVDNDSEYAYAGGVPVVYKRNGRFAQLSSSEVAMDGEVRIRDNPNPADPLCG